MHLNRAFPILFAAYCLLPTSRGGQQMNDLTGREAQRIINCVAPIRICDNGGWTDTWFAKTGKIVNIGVYPYVQVQVEVFKNDAPTQQIVVFAENYGQRFAVTDAQSGGTNIRCFRRPLLG